MAATFVQEGYGQIEANLISALVNGEMVSNVPAYTTALATTPIKELENGMFLCVIPDTTGKSPMGRIAVLPGAADATAVPLLVYSERKVYDERLANHDFVDAAADKVDGTLYPRLFKTVPEIDTWTTNTLNEMPGTVAVGDEFFVGDDGYLTKTAGTNTAVSFVVTKVYTMPSGQPGVKLMPQTV